MLTKNQLLTKINTLKSYCDTNRTSGVSGDFGVFLQPLISAINTYFSTIPNDLKYDLMKLITQIDLDITLRNTTYEHSFGAPLPTNFPNGYNDFGLIFDGDGAFTEINAMSGSQFLAGFPKTNDLTDPTKRIYQTNPIIATWTEKILNAHSKEPAKIETIIDFCEMGSYNNGLISMFEDRGQMTVHITKEELAHDIYITKGAKSIIQNFNLNVYIPSYI